MTARVWRQPVPGLAFNPDTHEYQYQGTKIPSVTSILSAVGHVYKSQAMEMAWKRGTAVHLATQYFDEGRLDPKSVDPILIPYLTAYIAFLGDVQPEILLTEQPVYHPVLQYAGTADRVVKINGVTGVLDIKTGSAPMHTNPQLAAYYAALKTPFEMTGGKWCLVLKSDGTYKLSSAPELDHWEMFKAALVIYRWKERHS